MRKQDLSGENLTADIRNRAWACACLLPEPLLVTRVLSDTAEWGGQARFSFSRPCRALLNSQKTRNYCSQDHSNPGKASKELTEGRSLKVPRLSAVTWLLLACVLGWRGSQLVPPFLKMSVWAQTSGRRREVSYESPEGGMDRFDPKW